jgi:DNA polymerase theta
MNFCLVSHIVLDDFSRVREGFVLAFDLHLVYLTTPISIDVEPYWQLYYERFIELPAIDQVILLLIIVVSVIPNEYY